MTSKIHQCLLFVSSALLLVVFQISVWGQSAANSGQISGQVLDSSGLAVPGLEVSARNKDTNLIRITITDEAGRYAIGPLPLSNYQVILKPANLEEATQDVYVSLGGRSTANFQLGVQPVRQSVTVTADAPGVIEPSQTFSKSILTEIQLRNLPAPGRRIKNLFLLTPATQIEPECGGFSISGQKGVFTSFNVDGGRSPVV